MKEDVNVEDIKVEDVKSNNLDDADTKSDIDTNDEESLKKFLKTDMSFDHTQYDHCAPVKQYKCKICHDLFTDRDQFILHGDSHLNKDLFRCQVCEKAFSFVSCLKTHLITHSKYLCIICLKQLSRKDNLEIHMRLHTGERPYSCSLCSSTFMSYRSVPEHMKKHMNMPFMCDICEKKFVNKKGYVDHMKQHSVNEYPHVCDICKKSFKLLKNLRRHAKLHIGNI